VSTDNFYWIRLQYFNTINSFVVFCVKWLMLLSKWKVLYHNLFSLQNDTDKFLYVCCWRKLSTSHTCIQDITSSILIRVIDSYNKGVPYFLQSLQTNSDVLSWHKRRTSASLWPPNNCSWSPEIRSSSKCYLRIQSVPQREHHTLPLQRSTG
jgi:hypothetical protein